MKAEGPGGAGIRTRAPFFRSRVARIVLALGVGVVALVVVSVFWPPRVPSSAVLYDNATLRNLAGALIQAGSPVAADGRLDVYGALGRAGTAPADLVAACRSRRSGSGPTATEIEAGDYGSFPWQRRLGALDPKATPPVPILWERSQLPTENGAPCRIVAYSDGSVRGLFDDEDAAMLEFFRLNPGQE